MEAPPSPANVGREFVRQYYTLLNKAPAHLHRFYNNQSSFVHGGLDPPHRETMPMIGQKQIHQKIQQLNFQDCHAKITQVDAQATLGNGVVVQVTGELSNAGQPMRRFTQTFVLAAQSPKKYYVHNDIFRYQDEIISDEECDNDARSGDEADMNQERPEMQQLGQQNMANYYNPQVPPHHQQHHVMQPVPPPQQQQQPQQVPVVQPTPAPLPIVNGAVHQEEVMPPHIGGQTLQPMGAELIKNELPVTVPIVDEFQAPAVEEGAGDIGDKNQYMDGQTKAPEPDHMQMSSEPVSNEPKTFANLFKSSSAPFPVSGGNIYQSSNQPPKTTSPPPMMKIDNRDRDNQFNSTAGNLPRSHRNDNRDQRNNGRPSGGPPMRGPRTDMRTSVPRDIPADGEERRRSQGGFADSNQLFLGNIPLWASEDDLRELFEKFGTIADLRILSKGNKPGVPGARAPPNYGFITYESPAGVQACLEAKPISLQDKNSAASAVLNVEEKKVKERTSYSNNMRNNPNDNLSPRPPRDNTGPRRGPLPGGGQPRSAGGPMGGGGGGGQRPNTFNRGGGQANRAGGPNTYTRR